MCDHVYVYIFNYWCCTFLEGMESWDVIEHESATSSFGDEEGDKVEDAEENKVEGDVFKHMRTLNKLNGILLHGTMFRVVGWV